MKEFEKDSQMRKAQITINNPEEHGFTHERIKEELAKMKPCIFWIMSDEVGGKDGTYHTHIYVVFRTPVRFSTIKNRFPVAHIENAVASHASNINYVKKEGKWKDTDKGATSVSGTIEQWGTCPPDAAGTDIKLIELYTYIKEGLSNYEILEKSADYLFDTDRIDRIRLILKQEEFKNSWRKMDVTYIWGKTGLGKSRYVMEKHGYANVFRVTDNVHPWDTYQPLNDVVAFEEFASSFPIQKMLNYLDGYPLKLEARYSDKIACYTQVYIISNMDLSDQYSNIQKDSPDVWEAFLRRINRVMFFKSEKEILTFNSVQEYLNHKKNFHEPTGSEVKELQEAFPDTLPFQ